MLEEEEPLRLRFDHPHFLWGQIRQLGEDFGSNCNILKASGSSCNILLFSFLLLVVEKKFWALQVKRGKLEVSPYLLSYKMAKKYKRK